MKKTKKQKPVARSRQVKKIVSRIRKTKIQENVFLSLGNVAPEKARHLVLIIAIIFVCTIALIQQYALNMEPKNKAESAFSYVPKENAITAEIKKMVKGYPIEKMTPYIAKQDPAVAAFLIAIAKKESAWGNRHPVLDGKDCYNYWGFRLKTDKMGSGGHTCFDSPEQAVTAVASRLDELVNNENIDTPKDMIVWKCGYGCQDLPKTDSEKKWIKDVNMYYQPLMN